MKKLVLTSLLAVFAATGANAAAINDNPLYRPDQGNFYSVTELSSHSEDSDSWVLGEKFGYGITDRAAVYMSTDFNQKDWFDGMGWDSFEVGADYRLLDDMNWKIDAYASYAVAPVWGDHQPFLDKDHTNYTWGVGVRAGYMTELWTVAGHVEFNYLNSESFNWGDDGIHSLIAGLDGFLVLDSNWSMLIGAEYTGMLDDQFKNAGVWTGKFGMNYNIDDDMFIGAYLSGEMDHRTGDWEVADGFGFGVKFGAQF